MGETSKDVERPVLLMPRNTSSQTSKGHASLLAHETLYVGVDIGKRAHVAGFLSTTLLARHQRFEHCPALSFENSREGFRSLIDRMETYVPLVQVQVLYVRYNQRIKQELFPQPGPLRNRGKICLPHIGGIPHDRHTLGTVSTGKCTQSGAKLAPEASELAACSCYD
jgi:hypothetical protein